MTNGLKILYHHRIGSRDGQAVHLEEMIAALRRAGAEVILVGPRSFAQASFGHDPKLLGRLKRMLPRALYEVLELGYNIPAYLRLAKACRAARPDILYERYNLGLAAGVVLKRLHGTPLLLEVNAPLARERAQHDGLALRGLARRIESWIWRNADRALPVTRVLADEMVAQGVAEDHVQVIPNGIDPSQFGGERDPAEAKRALGLDGKCVVGFTGFMRDWHGLDTILDWLALPATPAHVHLVLAGEGPALAGLKAQAAASGIEGRISFMGLVGREDIARIVAAFDIALQPKCVSYASPLKLFEYMALGKAILAPDQPNLREVLDGEQTALLFDPQNPQTLTAGLDRLVADPGLRLRLGEAARDAVVARGLTWDENARRVIALAQRLRRR